MARRPRRDLIPNANSPQLLVRLVEAVAQGVRSSRGLQEVLGVDLRTVNYYTQAAEWLGMVETGGEVCLTGLGLEYAYAGETRPAVYARAVWAQPFVAGLMEGEERTLPDVVRIATAIAMAEPEMAPATVQRRAGAVRSLIAPAVAATVEKESKPQLHQLALPLALHTEASAPPRLERASSHEYNPDVYRFLLGSLLDHGELTLGQVRALLDRADVRSAPIGGYIDLALNRGDATRIDERLVASRGAIAGRDLADTTTSVVLSDPGYRRYLADILASGRDGGARARRDQARARYRSWDLRLFGREAAESTLQLDLDKLLLERSLDSFPTSSGPGLPLESRTGPFIDRWRERNVPVAAPPHLEQLQGGVAAINRLLKAARQAGGEVQQPDAAHRPSVFHGGLLYPGEALPRSIPDTRSLRVRLLSNAPWPAMAAGLLLLHRQRSDRFEASRRAGAWEVWRGRKRLGSLMNVLDAFARSREWIVCRRRTGGLPAGRLIGLMEVLGIASEVGDNVVLAESFFTQLRTEAEEIELYEKLAPLSEAIGQFLEETPTTEGRDLQSGI